LPSELRRLPITSDGPVDQHRFVPHLYGVAFGFVQQPFGNLAGIFV
jgi:hypothetical protein